MSGQVRNRHFTAPKERLVSTYGSSRASVRRLIVKLIIEIEGGEFYSTTLREIFRVHHGVDIGMYTHGGCFRPYAFGRNTTIGRYTSVAATAFAATDNHPMEYKSTHGFFFNPTLGLVDREWEHSPLSIGSDVWLGHNSIIMPQVDSVGDGAVVGAGAVVFKDVPPYAVVVGNPGRVVRYRFDPTTIALLLAERWWQQDIDEIQPHIDEYTRQYSPESADGARSVMHPASTAPTADS
jgi:virginiamycin A acetyltransferase